MKLRNLNIIIDKIGLDKPKVDETAVDEIAVNEPSPNPGDETTSYPDSHQEPGYKARAITLPCAQTFSISSLLVCILQAITRGGMEL